MQKSGKIFKFTKISRYIENLVESCNNQESKIIKNVH